MNAYRAMLAKDLRVELRTLQSIPAMALFAISAFVLFRYGLDRRTLEAELAAGVLLLTILFAAILAINRLFVAERDEGGFDRFRLSPAEPWSLLAAKASAAFIYLVALEAVAVPAFLVLFGGSLSSVPGLIVVLALLNAGLAIPGALVSSMAANSSARDLIVPLVLLPLLVPLVIAAAAAAAPLLEAQGPSWDGVGGWLVVLALYDMTFALVGFAVYDFLLDD